MNLQQHKLEVANVSDVGCRRSNNEDSTASDAGLGILVLADGMGGHNAGEVASSIAVTSVYHDIILGLGNLEPDKCSQLIYEATNNANSIIYKVGKEYKQCEGMGTTIIVALVHDGKISIAHVGDSRLYRIRNNNFEQITKDHSLVQELVDRGLFSLEEAKKNAPRNLVTRALGLKAEVKIDIIEEQLAKNDIYLVCSDGLTDMVENEEIRLTLSRYSDNLIKAADKLVEKAKEYGGIDNISVILCSKFA